MMSMKADLVSIVTPFYNTEDYLDECISSVLNQSYDNFEYLLVNNCSSDSSVEIAERYSRRDKRIKLIHNQLFLPQVANYNNALRQISPYGKYCKIVQADDFIYPNCISEMVGIAESDPEVAIVGSFTVTETDLLHKGIHYANTVLPGKELLRRYITEKLKVIGSPTCVMYRTADVLSRNPFFSETSPIEDIEACFDLLMTGKFGFVHQVLSFSRRENDSIISAISSFNVDLLYYMILTYRYGPALFSGAELTDLLERVESEYYSFMGRALFQRRSEKFWDYHIQGLASVGLKINRLRCYLNGLETLLKHIVPGIRLFSRSFRRFLNVLKRSRHTLRAEPKSLL